MRTITTHRALTTALTLGAALTAAGPASGQEILTHDLAIPGRYLVVLAEGAARQPGGSPFDGPSVPEVASAMALRYNGAPGRSFEHALQGFVLQTDEAGARGAARDPRVAYVAQDARVSVASVQVEPPSWGLDRIDQREAALDGAYLFPGDGSGVDVYVIDTGIRSTHADFAGRVDTAAAFTAIDDGRGTEDCNGHGTHVAGIVGGTTYGAAKGVTLHPVRVLDCNGSGSLSGVIAGIDWVTKTVKISSRGKKSAQRPAVANLSIGTSAYQPLDDAVSSSIAQGVTYVVAAGNNAADACLYSPARVAEAITVGASDAADARPSWSNFGSCLDLFAPGAAITSAFNRSDTDFVAGSGTSMAAPHAAAAAALYLASSPDASPAEVAQAVVAHATAGRLSALGAGSPDRLVYSLLGDDGIDDPPFATFTADCDTRRRACTFDAAGSLDDLGIASYLWDFGDGDTASRERVRHRFPSSPGAFIVTLYVTDTAGQTSLQQREIRFSW